MANLSDYVENDSASHVSVLPDDYVEDGPRIQALTSMDHFF